MCSKRDNHSRLNSQHDWEKLYEHLVNTWIFTLIIKYIVFIHQNYEVNNYGHNLDSLIILHQSHISYPMTSGCREKSITHVYLYILCLAVCLRPTYLGKGVSSSYETQNDTAVSCYWTAQVSIIFLHSESCPHLCEVINPLLFCGDQTLENEVRILHEMKIDDTE